MDYYGDYHDDDHWCHKEYANPAPASVYDNVKVRYFHDDYLHHDYHGQSRGDYHDDNFGDYHGDNHGDYHGDYHVDSHGDYHDEYHNHVPMMIMNMSMMLS